MTARHSGYRALSSDEITVIVDTLNRAGRGWLIALSSIKHRPRRISNLLHTWTIVMPHGETFAHTDDLGWLYVGVVAQPDGGIP